MTKRWPVSCFCLTSLLVIQDCSTAPPVRSPAPGALEGPRPLHPLPWVFGCDQSIVWIVCGLEPWSQWSDNWWTRWVWLSHPLLPRLPPLLTLVRWTITAALSASEWCRLWWHIPAKWPFWPHLNPIFLIFYISKSFLLQILSLNIWINMLFLYRSDCTESLPAILGVLLL